MRNSTRKSGVITALIEEAIRRLRDIIGGAVNN
jgi:hypothetical protein